MKELSILKNKKVLLTGHTGFKGSWMSVALLNIGASVIGYSSCKPNDTRLFDLCGIKQQVIHIKGDVRDLDHLKRVFAQYQPEIVIHMAAQSIVNEGYLNPVYTYDTNVMGTVNILECIRLNSCVKSFLNVTTDKVYENKEWEWGYRENETLNGYDPYSNSKSCSDLITQSYKKSYFPEGRMAISTARAGNVIGGGDFAKNRIIPDCVRAVIDQNDIVIRNPFSVRPYQHVLEAVYAYLMIVAKQYQDYRYAGCYNVGPDDQDWCQTRELVRMFVKNWGKDIKIIEQSDGGYHEASMLKLDCSKIKATFGWRPMWNLETAVEKVIEWTKCWNSNGDIRNCMDNQINEYLYQI